MTLRPFDYDGDVTPYAALLNEYDSSEPVTEQSLRDDRAKRLAEEIIFSEMTALDAAGVPVGFSYAGKRPWARQGKVRLSILVDPARRRAGSVPHCWRTPLAGRGTTASRNFTPLSGTMIRRV